MNLWALALAMQNFWLDIAKKWVGLKHIQRHTVGSWVRPWEVDWTHPRPHRGQGLTQLTTTLWTLYILILPHFRSFETGIFYLKSYLDVLVGKYEDSGELAMVSWKGELIFHSQQQFFFLKCKTKPNSSFQLTTANSPLHTMWLISTN